MSAPRKTVSSQSQSPSAATASNQRAHRRAQEHAAAAALAAAAGPGSAAVNGSRSPVGLSVQSSADEHLARQMDQQLNRDPTGAAGSGSSGGARSSPQTPATASASAFGVSPHTNYPDVCPCSVCCQHNSPSRRLDYRSKLTSDGYPRLRSDQLLSYAAVPWPNRTLPIPRSQQIRSFVSVAALPVRRNTSTPVSIVANSDVVTACLGARCPA
jgi:hypothetical protein